MTDDIRASMKVAGSGMQVQSARLRVVSQNIANAETTGQTPGADPYRRQTIHFKNVLDKEMDVHVVKVDKIDVDRSDFKLEYDPNHPAADAQGYVKRPNVTSMLEMMDLQQAQRVYEANLGVIEVSKSMFSRTLDLLR